MRRHLLQQSDALARQDAFKSGSLQEADKGLDQVSLTSEMALLGRR